MVLPLHVDTGLTARPYTNQLLIAVTVVTFLFNSRGMIYDGDTTHSLMLGSSGLGFFGHVFLHADGMHLLGNMVFLWVFGNAVCARLGAVRYLVCYALFTLTSAMGHLMFDGRPALGASGAVFGIVGMFFVFHPKDEVTFSWLRYGAIGTAPAWTLVALWFGLDIVGVFQGEDGIAHVAHLGGFLGGVIAAAVLLKNEMVPEPAGMTLLDIIERDS